MAGSFKPDKGRFYKMAFVLFLLALAFSQFLNFLWDLIVKGAM